MAWLRSPVGSANGKVLMFELSSQVPASSFIAVTICCDGKAMFKLNIHMWVLDDSEASAGVNEWAYSCCLGMSMCSSYPCEFREQFGSICRNALSLSSS